MNEESTIAPAAGSAAPSEPEPPPLDRFTFVTYNVGLLRYRMCFGMVTVFANPPHVEERLAMQPQALRQFPADVLALQECYEEAHAQFLCTQLADLYPYHARFESGGCIKFHNGLLVLSKHPIVHSELQSLDRVASLERHMATKSNLIVDLDVGNNVIWRIVNTHTTAGGTVDPENPDTDQDREDELKQAADSAAAINNKSNSNNPNNVGIIIGDLNCGPEASPDNFNYILQKRHFRDTYQEAADGGTLLTTSPQYTWDPKNYLNQLGPHKDCPGQRCDHVLLPMEGMKDWQVKQVQLILEEPVVDIGKDKAKCTLSDHYGLLVSIQKESATKIGLPLSFFHSNAW